jgi:3-hydroxy-9,10-secoandrosta-1,3,5(10)-triene-9,17-dione monooxygenase
MNPTIDFLGRARALAPVLAERVAEASRLRRLPDATIADLREAGFFRLLQPARWGGHEADPRIFFEVQMTLAAACASTAWVLGVVAVHSWQLALFPLAAQEEVWGKDPEALISSSYAPTGKVVRVDGGFRISGRWSFSSGCDHCSWVFLGGFVPVAAGEKPDMRTFLLGRADYRIEDNWHVAGLQGTGSKDIVVEDAFVPEHRTHRLIDGYLGKSPGNAVNPAALFRVPFGQLFVRSVSTSAIGIAQGCLDAYLAIAEKRIAAGDGAKVAEDPATQAICARAAAEIDEVRQVLHRNLDELMAAAREERQLPVERRARFRYDSSNAVERCKVVVDDLFTSSGGRAIFLSSPILRHFLDIHAARAHYANNPEKPARNFGGLQLKLRNADYFI